MVFGIYFNYEACKGSTPLLYSMQPLLTRVWHARIHSTGYSNSAIAIAIATATPLCATVALTALNMFEYGGLPN